jgi:hypothetical protein
MLAREGKFIPVRCNRKQSWQLLPIHWLGYRLDDRDSIPATDFSLHSRLEPTHSNNQWVPKINRWRLQTWHPPSTTANVRNAWGNILSSQNDVHLSRHGRTTAPPSVTHTSVPTVQQIQYTMCYRMVWDNFKTPLLMTCSKDARKMYFLEGHLRERAWLE